MLTGLQLPVPKSQVANMSNDKTAEPLPPSFTPVNGTASPPSPRRSAVTNPTSAHPTSYQHPDQRQLDSSFRGGGDHSTAPSLPDAQPSPNSPNKRRRSDPAEDGYGSMRAVDPVPPRSLPPTDRPLDRPSDLSSDRPSDRPSGDHERPRATESQPSNGYQTLRDANPADSVRSGMPPMALSHPLVQPNHFEPPNPATVRNGVQVDVKKRKRQFANRTKTGCGTCRRRKKKCDEAKPECNNCMRGGFVCEGYASKVPWPKTGPAKPPPPLQAKEHMPHDPSGPFCPCRGCHHIHAPHCDTSRGGSQSSYSDARLPNVPEGARTRSTAADGQERKSTAPSIWGSSWTDPSRASYAERQPGVSAQYAQAPPPSHDRTSSHEHHIIPPPQRPPPPQQHNPPHMYHQTLPSMSQPPNRPSAMAMDNNHAGAQATRQLPISSLSSTPPAPPQSRRAAPYGMSYRTEKDKMLDGEPFLPYNDQLVDERKQCTQAVQCFNNTANPSVQITLNEVDRIFKRIVQAGWIQPRNTDRRPGVPSGGHYGGNIRVSTPFHCDYGYNLSIGDNVCFGPHCQLLDSARIAIGRNTKIGSRVIISTIKTPTDLKSMKGTNGTEIARDVYIGENVYIGDAVVIEAGVKIGNNAIIRAGSVVAGDIADDTIASGNPAFSQLR